MDQAQRTDGAGNDDSFSTTQDVGPKHPLRRNERLAQRLHTVAANGDDAPARTPVKDKEDPFATTFKKTTGNMVGT